MRKTIVMAMACSLLPIFAATAQANTTSTDFETMALGPVNGQQEWSMTGNYDVAVAPGFGGRALRVSNDDVSENMSDMPFSKPTAKAGEAEPNKVLVSEFTFISTKPDQLQRGLSMSISQTDSQGARMSYVRLEDEIDGVRVFFNDSPNQYSAEFNDRWIATLDRTVPHTIKIASKYVPGNDNDVVRVYIDGEDKACGTSWENYYRFTEMMTSKESSGYVLPSDRLMWRLRDGVGMDTSTSPATPWPPVAGGGFLFDNVSNTSQESGGPESCSLPSATTLAILAPAAGATTIVQRSSAQSRLIGDTLRVIHAPVRKGQRFISARATMRNKRLPAHRRSITVDLRGRNVGNYNVYVSAKYRTKSGKLHVERFMRALSVTLLRPDASQ